MSIRQGPEGNTKKVEILNNKNEIQATLTVLQDFHNVTQGVCGGKSQVLSAKPVLEADAPLSVQGLLSKLDHQQCSLDVQPVLEQSTLLSWGCGGGEGLEEIFTGAPEQTLEDAFGVRNEDALRRVGV